MPVAILPLSNEEGEAMSTIDIAFVTLVLMAFAGFAVVLAYF